MLDFIFSVGVTLCIPALLRGAYSSFYGTISATESSDDDAVSLQPTMAKWCNRPKVQTPRRPKENQILRLSGR